MKIENAICPYCKEIAAVTGNGEWICPECGETFSVDFFREPNRRPSRIRPVPQPDEDTCGLATCKWLLESFGCKSPTKRILREELNVDKSTILTDLINSVFGTDWNMNGTTPGALLSVLKKHGLRFVKPDIRDQTIGFFQSEDYLEKVFGKGGRIACVYQMGGLTFHWVGIEEANGVRRVMDPLKPNYTDLSRHEVFKHNFLLFGFIPR